MLSLLNRGFSWQDPESGKVIKVAKHSPPIEITNLRDISQQLLMLSFRRSQIDSARWLPLVGVARREKQQEPTGIEIIHCPFSLSSCLNLQNPEEDAPDYAQMLAHYIIPSDDTIIETPIQIAHHRNSLIYTDKKGQDTFTDNKIIIMLTGDSGRLYGNNNREPANPSWVSKWQLKRMGELVLDICDRLDYEAELEGKDFAVEECSTIGKGLSFRTDENYGYQHWGDIADFDPAIFHSYIQHPEGLEGSTKINIINHELEIPAGKALDLQLTFQPRVYRVELEQLVRCSDSRVVWSPVSVDYVRSSLKYDFKKFIWDSGPNRNGSHFYRAKVYGAEGMLLGWDTVNFFITNYEQIETPAITSSCN